MLLTTRGSRPLDTIYIIQGSELSDCPGPVSVRVGLISVWEPLGSTTPRQEGWLGEQEPGSKNGSVSVSSSCPDCPDREV